jgi:hypothetical protein
VPGHSLGSVRYVDFANKIAITGDAVSSGRMVYVFAPSCAALDEYLDGLKKAEERLKLSGWLRLTTVLRDQLPLRGPMTELVSSSLPDRSQLFGPPATSRVAGIHLVDLRRSLPDSIHRDRIVPYGPWAV